MQIEPQSGIVYLETEQTISAQTGRLIRDPIRVFDIAALGIDKERFLHDLAPSFDELAWDPYEARNRRFALLKSFFPTETKRLDAVYPAFYEKRRSCVAPDCGSHASTDVATTPRVSSDPIVSQTIDCAIPCGEFLA